MARVTELDVSGLHELLASLKNLGGAASEAIEDTTKYIAAAVESEARRNTKKDVKRRTGTLEKSWFMTDPVKDKQGITEVKVCNNASVRVGSAAPARLAGRSAKVTNPGKKVLAPELVGRIKNARVNSRLVSYAVYVENGHRTAPNKKGRRGWVAGRFMLRRAVAKVEQSAGELVERGLIQRLQEEFDK